MDILKSLAHPDEVYGLLKFKLNGCQNIAAKSNTEQMDEGMRKCYEILNKTSRSFAAVIQALDEELRYAVCIFYVVLRALDTVEDDMTIPLPVKIPMLISFHKNLYDPEWKFMDSKEKDGFVLEEFQLVSAQFRGLEIKYQDVIAKITKEMGQGMTVYLDRSPGTLAQWDEYCHYVAGLVGIGLSSLFSESNLENNAVAMRTELSNSMGLFLQKTNIIRDYREDALLGREFWPQQVWGEYVNNQSDLLKTENNHSAVECLNELVTNALRHIPDCLKYLSQIKNQSVFNFCAIPQVMAIATLERCYNNPEVFSKVVKIRKGETVKMMMTATSIDSVKTIMTHYCLKIKSRIPHSKSAQEMEIRDVIEDALKLAKTEKPLSTCPPYLPIYVSTGLILIAIVWQYWTLVGCIFDPSTS